MDYRSIKTLKEQVKAVLASNVSARNDDAILIEQVCRDFGYLIVDKASAIERCRRYWQGARYDEGGRLIKVPMFVPTDERVAKQRRMNIDEWRVALGYPTEGSARTEKPSWTPPSEKRKQSTLL